MNEITNVAIIGAGTMGQGIAQLAMQAGHSVVLVDQSQEQLDSAQQSFCSLFTRFVDKKKVTQEQAAQWLSSLSLNTDIQAVCDSQLVIEAIVERMDVKQSLFAQIEGIVDKDAILASNTSSLSVTEIASSLKYPERFIGLHFFNPPGIMPLVEVVKAIQSDEKVIRKAESLVSQWGKSPVCCKDTPSFIVNRVARPYYIESFRLLEEGALEPHSVDACLRTGMNFRMGPCELTDFIGHDVNYAVSQSLWQALGYPKHLQPSFVQNELVAAQYLGRKSGKGFYDYSDVSESIEMNPQDTVDFNEARKPVMSSSLARNNYIGTLDNDVSVFITDGRRAIDWEMALGIPVALIDISDVDVPDVRAICYSPLAKKRMHTIVPAVGDLTLRWVVMPDRPGLVNLRVVSLIINEGASAVLHGVTDEKGIDTALKGGVNYPKGSFEWLESIGLETVCKVLTALGDYYGNTHYMPSPYLKDSLEAVV